MEEIETLVSGNVTEVWEDSPPFLLIQHRPVRSRRIEETHSTNGTWSQRQRKEGLLSPCLWMTGTLTL